MGTTHLRSDIREHGEITASITNIQTTTLLVTTGNIETLNATDAYIKTLNATESNVVTSNITTGNLTTGNIVTLNATDANVSASLIVGNVASHVRIDKRLGVRLVGIQAWEDLRVPVSTVVVNPVNSKPDWVAFVGNTRALGFDNAASEWVSFSAQMPHNYLQGSDIEAHLHWSATDGAAGGVRWVLDYTWANIGSPFGALASLAETSAAASANTHTYCDLEWLTGTGKTVSSVLMCRLWRDVAHTDDDYAADAALLEFDFHYRVDGFGSEEEDSKA